MTRRRIGIETAACAFAGVLTFAAGAAAAATHAKSAHAPGAHGPHAHVPLPRPRPNTGVAQAPGAAPTARPAGGAFQTASITPAGQVPSHGEPVFTSSISLSGSDLASVKQAIEFARRGKSNDATDIEGRIEDPLARKLVEWAILHSDENNANFARYRAFITANPGWPHVLKFRRRAEAMLWQERADLAAIKSFIGNAPSSAKGAFALGRALLAQGDQAAAQAAIRGPWRTESLSHDLEEQLLQTFGGLITRADEKARMERRLYANEKEAAMRAAHRLGGAEPAIAKARIAVNEKASNAKALLDALPASEQRDPGVMFSRIQWLRRSDKIAEAVEVMLAAPRDAGQIHDADEWWIERRLLARKLLDLGETKTAYQVARDAVSPAKENYRVEHEFTAGWIALRFLNDPALAAQHFGRMGTGVTNPIALARTGYWRGRAAEAMNRTQEARSHYEQAARYSTAYYGQIARARLGMAEITVAPSPLDRRAAPGHFEVARAVEILYAINERDLVIPIVADMGERAQDVGTLAAVAEVAAHYEDARAVLLVGKEALARGYPFDHYAFPTFGLPRYSAIGPEVEPEVVYAIARQESAFNPRDRSSANAVGLMQVTPAAGRETAKRFNVGYDEKRMVHDQVYNMQLGAAELADVIGGYRGSYIMAFAGYNAGRGRVRDWVERYGDPRDPNVDPVDWVERIPFSETRNYVQRILENIQVYRVRFGGSPRLLIEADIHRGANTN